MSTPASGIYASMPPQPLLPPPVARFLNKMKEAIAPTLCSPDAVHDPSHLPPLVSPTDVDLASAGHPTRHARLPSSASMAIDRELLHTSCSRTSHLPLISRRHPFD
ncbi:hypothetical protein IEQ34_003583 [Dendrobium chrysotoxum]|uniref:Uncharacterized protein n=1 Tax=Dendrobium chrysotoxum TaxID=161865 RepID=A0AAV7HK44_DENCH|nr:hypothetical protein IEQ34_003583 [Dendrobium chrysotoxum]